MYAKIVNILAIMYTTATIILYSSSFSFLFLNRRHLLNCLCLIITGHCRCNLGQWARFTVHANIHWLFLVVLRDNCR